MNLRTVAAVAGVLGGLAWVARCVLDLMDASTSTLDGLYWVGLVLLAVAFFGFGTNLVSQGALWLQVIVGIAFPALVWSVLEVFHGSDPELVDGVFGAVVVVVSVVALRRARRAGKRRAGAHAR